jgi:hypothetical protein
MVDLVNDEANYLFQISKTRSMAIHLTYVIAQIRRCRCIGNLVVFREAMWMHVDVTSFWQIPSSCDR